MAGKPAARIGDPTCHGGTLVGPGVPTILIGGMPASTMGDTHVCPMCTPAPVPIPHVGGPVILGSTGVMLGKKPAARMGDMAVCVGPPSSIIMGCPTVLIGEVGSGSQGSGAGAASPAEVSPPGTGTATALALAAATSTTGQSHAIDLEFVDASGRPLAGIPFHLKDPQGNVTLAASDPQGSWTRTGLAQAGSYTVEVRLLRNARCDQSKIQSGTACRFSCEAPGFPDGTPAVIRLQVMDTDHKARTIDSLRTEVKAEKIEATWTLEPQALAQASHQQAGQAALESLDAVFTAGVQCLVGKPVPLELKVAPLELPTGKLGAAHFRTDGCVPLLDEKNELIELLAELLDYGEDAKGRGETAVLFGNSSSSGSPEHNRELSLWRGKMVKALLDHDEIAWRNTARTHAKPEDARQILSSLHKAHGWECDPESQATKTHGIQEFQKEANSRFDLDLTEDGILGPKTWTAIHRVLCALIQDELGYDPDQEPDWPLLAWGFGEGAGVYPNGSDHATGGNKESERNVEVSFFPKGCEPKLKLPKNGKKGTVKENPREDGKMFEKGALPKAAPSNETIKVALFFDGTWNNRIDDTALQCESNIAKLYELFVRDERFRYRHYYEGVGTGRILSSDSISGGLGGRGAQERIDRAFADLKDLSRRRPNSKWKLSLFGFSRGAATARSFVNQLYANPAKIGVTKLPFEKIEFMGIFDTVGSFGNPGDFDEAGHDLSVHSSRIAQLVHLIARDEKRSLFPLTTIKASGTSRLPPQWEERTYPGVHSDLGGGYGNTKSRQELLSYESDVRFREEREGNQASTNQMIFQTEKPNLAKLEAEAPRDCLSRIPFWVMYDLAMKAGVPFRMHEVLRPPPADSHSTDWWHVASEEEKRKATWVRFKSHPKGTMFERVDIPPKLFSYWENRHTVSQNGNWIESETDRTNIEYFQHDSLYAWESHAKTRMTKDLGVID